MIELTTEFSPLVDEAFTRESKRDIVTNRDYDFTGVNTIKIYKVTTSEMNDYDRNGTGPNPSRYGEIKSLDATTQEEFLSRDRSFTFAIDTLDMDETKKAIAGASALARQIRQVVIPEVDAWTYKKMSENAGNLQPYDAITPPVNPSDRYKFYDMILRANVLLDNAFVPETDRFIIISPLYYAMLKQDTDIVFETDIGQDMRLKGVVSYIDGLKVIKVPASRLPEKFIYLIGHPSATVAPVKLESYKVHTDPPFISGDLVEGRINYDAFVLDNKKTALVYGYIDD